MVRLRNRISILVACLILVIDQIVKQLLNRRMELGDSVPLIKNVLHISLVHNRGAGFGILQGGRLFFIIFSFLVLGYIIYKWKHIPKDAAIPLGLILGGLFGNLIDRIFFGYVIDFIEFRIWPVFNVADSAITIGVIWLYVQVKKRRMEIEIKKEDLQVF